MVSLEPPLKLFMKGKNKLLKAKQKPISLPGWCEALPLTAARCPSALIAECHYHWRAKSMTRNYKLQIPVKKRRLNTVNHLSIAGTIR